jgi:mannose-6-phosphate isomerase-like protein (cupin superfamily)
VVDEILSDGIVHAIVVRAAFKADGITFFTSPDAPQQLGYMHHRAGHQVAAHTHHDVSPTQLAAQEVLMVRSGRIRVDFFRSDHAYLCSRVLGVGDVVLLAAGGHSVTVLEECELIEVKQGPYRGTCEKNHFEPDLPEALEYGDLDDPV